MDFDYPMASVCENGHLVSNPETSPGGAAPYCSQCGAPMMRECRQCGAEIPGYVEDGEWVEHGVAPKYCGACGKPYPWTQAAIAAWQELVSETEGLTDAERDTLSRSIHDLVQDTPRTTLAVERVKRTAGKLGPPMIQLLTSVATDAAKKLLGLG